MEKVEAQDLTAAIVKLHGKYSAIQYFEWLLDDAFADITATRKKNPPPAEVVPTLFKLAGMYAKAVAQAEPFSDLLGGVYMDLSSSYGKAVLGQYFTPECIARMMAKMSYQIKSSDKLIKICDPACGSGVMMLQMAAEILEREGVQGLERYSFIGVDLDYICARMCAVQMLSNTFVHGLNYGEVLIYRGNSLTGESLTPIVHAALPEREDEIFSPSHPSRVEMVQDAARKSSNAEQLPLFG